MNRNKKALALKYFMILAVVVGSFCIMSAAGIFAYMLISDPKSTDIPPSVDIKSGKTIEYPYETNNANISAWEETFKAPPKTNFVLMGVDENGLSDVIMAGCFDTKAKKISLISIPRDTYVKMPQDRIQQLNALGRKGIPSGGGMKINAVHGYAGKEYGAEYVLKQVEDILCVEMDYYIEVGLGAFRKIVDDVGGVQMEIPGKGLYYEDPEQDLVINIPGGIVNLDGKNAEGLVRYRASYLRADLQRVEVQQEFLKELFKQTLAKDKLLKNAPALISTFISYVKTDFKLADLPKYLGLLDELASYEIVTATLPGSAERSVYYEHDVELTANLIEEIFY